ncbi:MAG: 50S ribosomal protein L16 [bacterium]|nr:50S ribosomal protein L16 [bacterium]
MALLMPSRSKYRKQFRGKRGGVATRGAKIDFGQFGLQALEAGWVTSRQIEAARKAIAHETKRGGKIWIRVFPDKPVSKKPAEVKMGGGKGDVDHYVAVVKPGRVLFELAGVPKALAEEAFRLAGHKFAIGVRFIEKE